VNQFLPQARAHADNDKPIVLLYDGHGLHIQESIVDAAMEQRTTLYLLPAHTTHKLQPCDVGAFDPLKRHWATSCAQYLELTGKELGLKHVVLAYMAARRQAFLPDTIIKAWKKSGISVDADGYCVCTPDVFTAADFAPSTITSINAHLPGFFPDFNPTNVPEWAKEPDALQLPQLVVELGISGLGFEGDNTVAKAPLRDTNKHKDEELTLTLE
jgi:hypothetical protein